MKTLLMLLIAGLILTTTPLVASAHGSHQRDQRRSYTSSWVNQSGSRPEHRWHNNDWRGRDNVRHGRREWRENRRLRHELRETRRDLRHMKRRVRQQRRHSYYVVQPCSVNLPVVFGVPQLVFQFGW